MAVRRTLFVLAAVLVISIAAELPAQRDSAPSTSGHRAAVIDVARIFREHKRFRQLMEDMKTDLAAAEEAVKKERASIDELTKAKERFKSGTPEFNRVETELALRQLAFTKLATAQKQEFLQREARLYRDIYRDIQLAVTRHAERKGIDLVLRINEQESNPDDREAILRDLNRPIVYHRGMDITDVILAETNGESP